MNNHRLFNLFVTVALLALTVLTVREVAATVSVISHTAYTSQSTNEATSFPPECATLPSRSSVHAEYANGVWLPYTEDGPAGIDGGLIYLLSAYRACSH